MPRAQTTNPRAPIIRLTTVFNKKSDPAPKCCEDRDLFSSNNIDAAIDRGDHESDQDSDVVHLSTIHQHSKKVFSCSNAAAHPNEPHYTCTSCASLTNTYLRVNHNALLEGGIPPMKGQRFFPLCHSCMQVAKASGNRGCKCNYLGKELCFQCKRNYLEIATARRDSEVDSRLGFRSVGDKKPKVLFMKPVFKCICGNEKIEIKDEMECTLRCAGCEGLVTMMSGRVWDPLARDFMTFF